MKRNNYQHIIESGALLDVIEELKAQGMTRPTLRSCRYLLLDRGLLIPLKGGGDYDGLDRALSAYRDKGSFPYGLLAGDGGADICGMLPDQLDRYIKRLRENNVVPELRNGILKCVYCEKVGLLDYLVEAVGGRVPIGSPGGMIRKEWAWHWIGKMRQLAHNLGANRIELVYLGDYDKGGKDITNHSALWYQTMFDDVDYKPYAVTKTQMVEVANRLRGSTELHIDGYIALVNPKIFAQRLNEYLED